MLCVPAAVEPVHGLLGLVTGYVMKAMLSSCFPLFPQSAGLQQGLSNRTHQLAVRDSQLGEAARRVAMLEAHIQVRRRQRVMEGRQ